MCGFMVRIKTAEGGYVCAVRDSRSEYECGGRVWPWEEDEQCVFSRCGVSVKLRWPKVSKCFGGEGEKNKFGWFTLEEVKKDDYAIVFTVVSCLVLWRSDGGGTDVLVMMENTKKWGNEGMEEKQKDGAST